MFRNIAIGMISLSILTFGLSAAQAGPLGPTVCANNAPAAPAGCIVELKGYESWGVCVHESGDYCPAYVDGSGRLCVYANGDLACAPFEGIVGPTVCANNAPNAPAGCVVELKGYGSWGVCLHEGDDSCVYVNPGGDLCAYRNVDLACVPLL